MRTKRLKRIKRIKKLKKMLIERVGSENEWIVKKLNGEEIGAIYEYNGNFVYNPTCRNSEFSAFDLEQLGNFMDTLDEEK